MTADAPPTPPARRGLWIGCGVAVLLLVLCGGVLTFAAKRGFDLFQGMLAESAEDEAFAQRWTPPAADAPAVAFAPSAVAGYELKASDDQAAFPALGLDDAGRHAVYEKDGQTIDVAVYDADAARAAAVFDEVLRRIDTGDRFRSKSTYRTTRRLTFSIAPPELHGLLWSAQDRLVFVRSTTVADLEPFLKAYLEEIGRPAAIPEADAADTEPSDESPTVNEPASTP